MTSRFFRVDLEPPAWFYAWMARGPMFRRIYRRLAADLAAGLPLGARLLDVGTGPGYLLGHLARPRPDLSLFGMDLNYRMIRRGRPGGVSLIPSGLRQFLVADALALPFAAGVFHQVLASFTFHNWQEPEAGIREIMRVLKPGGRALIYEMNLEASAQDLRRFAGEEKLPFPLVYLGFKTISQLPRPASRGFRQDLPPGGSGQMATAPGPPYLLAGGD